MWFDDRSVEVVEMAVVVDEREVQVVDAASTEQRRLVGRGRTLPAGRIMLVPFSLVEVEQPADDDAR